MPESNPSERKPWPMRWTVLAIVGFIVLYTLATVFFRKEEAPHEPYAEARIRGGYDLREIGWEPFPNAYGVLSGDLSSETVAAGELPVTEEIALDILDRRDERVAAWADRLPPLEQGEQLRRLEAPAILPKGKPYIARLFWDAPEDFSPPQLLVLRQGKSILLIPRAPERFSGGNPEQTVFIIPPEFVESGEYEIFLSTEGRVNRWTFRAE